MSGQDEGQGGPQFPFTPQDALTFLTKMWNPLGIPMPGFGLPGAQGGHQRGARSEVGLPELGLPHRATH